MRLAGGSDSLAAAQEVQKRFAIPAIAATGQLTAADAKAAALLGILSKPHTSAALAAILECTAEWLERGTRRPFLIR